MRAGDAAPGVRLLYAATGVSPAVRQSRAKIRLFEKVIKMPRGALKRVYESGSGDCVSTLAADISGYSWLHVASDNPEYDGKCGCGVTVDGELSGFMRLTRHFAASLLFTSAVRSAARDGDTFRVTLRRGDTLRITASRERKFSDHKRGCDLNDIRLHHLARPEFFCPARGRTSDNERFATVDFGRVGALTDAQHDKIVRLMDVTLGGRGDDRQFCRTVYFAVDVATGAVRAGLYNLERERVETSFRVYTPGASSRSVLSAEQTAFAMLSQWGMK
jgi:hypothetical protein